MLGLIASPILLGACRSSESGTLIRAGDIFPDFSLPDLKQRQRLRAEFLGHPLLINFWATWCPPCREEMAGLQILHRRLEAIGGSVVGISVDDDINLVREFVLAAGVGFPVLLDFQRAYTSAALGLQSFPTSFLLRADGRVAEIVSGVRAWESPKVYQELLDSANRG